MKRIPFASPKPCDVRGGYFVRPVRETQATITTPPTPDEEEEPPKKLWRPCPHCRGLPNDGQFRLINIRWGLRQMCHVCKREERERMEATAFRVKRVENEANRFLRSHGVRLDWKGMMK